MEPNIAFQGIIFPNHRIYDIISFVIVFIHLCQLKLIIRIQITEHWKWKEIKDHLDSISHFADTEAVRSEVIWSHEVTTDYISYN